MAWMENARRPGTIAPMTRGSSGVVLRAALVVISLVLVWINGLFAFTDRAWIIMGAPDEAWPEFLYMVVGLPLALTAVAGYVGALASRLVSRVQPDLEPIVLGIATGALLFSALLAIAPFLRDWTLPLPDAVASAILLCPIPLMLMQFVLSIRLISLSVREERRAPSPR